MVSYTMQTSDPYTPTDFYIDFDSSTDKKLTIAWKIRGSLFSHTRTIFMGMNGCILGWDEDTFNKHVRSHINEEISDEAMRKLFDLYIRFNKKTIKSLKRESKNIAERVKKAKAFDFIAAEKRLKRIGKLLNLLDGSDKKSELLSIS